jgi:hypothetical protein
MPQLTFPVTAAGLAAPVWIGFDGKKCTALMAAGKPIPPPVQARGLLDTGSDVTAVALWVLQQLALAPVAKTVTHTAVGQVHDLRIAASCVVNSATLVTRNRRHFQSIPGLLVEFWDSPGRCRAGWHVHGVAWACQRLDAGRAAPGLDLLLQPLQA